MHRSIRSYLAARSRAFALASAFVFTLTSTAACGVSSRDGRDIAADLEGTVGEPMVARLLRDVDLSRAPLEVSAGRAMLERFESADQPRWESFLRESAEQLAGDSVRLTQQVLEDTGRDTQRLTVTLEVQHGTNTRYVPVELELLRDGRRVLVTRARVMAEVR